MGSEKNMMRFEYGLQSENQEKQNQWQAEQNDIDRNWQAEEWERQFMIQYEKQMEMYREQLGLQNEADFQKWKKQFDIENAYNDPKSQIARLMAAGVNPAAAASQFVSSGVSSAAVGGSSAPAAATAPSGGSVGSHSVSPISLSGANYSTNAQMISSLSQLGQTISKMAESGVSAYGTAKKINPEIDKVIAETSQLHEETALTKIRKDIEAMFGKSKAAISLQKDVVSSYTYYTEGKFNEAREALTRAQESLTEEQRSVLAEQRPELLSNLKLLGQLYESERKVNIEDVLYKKSGEVANYARAELDSAYAQTEKELREGKVTRQTLENGVSAIDFGLRTNSLERDNKTQQQQIYKILEECKRSGYISEKELSEARQSITNANWQETEKYLNLIRRALGLGNSLYFSAPIK